jgi:hypothetical protein
VKVDRILYLLFSGIVIFSIILILCEHYFMSDGQMFQVIASVLTGFTGAFFGRINPSQKSVDPGTTTVTATNILQEEKGETK